MSIIHNYFERMIDCNPDYPILKELQLMFNTQAGRDIKSLLLLYGTIKEPRREFDHLKKLYYLTR